MARYLLRRLTSVFVLLGISAMVFFIMRVAPGGPGAFTEDPRLGKVYQDQQRQEFGSINRCQCNTASGSGRRCRGTSGALCR
jgi:ABC-type microcin C transport system permease subunit YejB